jgi:hypothetical protein
MSYLFNEEFKNLQKLSEEFERLREAYNLLYRVYSETEPYNNTFSKELNKDLFDFFKFDDSE